MYFVVLWLNAFPVRNGVSKFYSPRSIVLHTKLNWKRHCQVPFGTYCEIHDEPDPSNDMTPRTHEGIAVGPTGNIQGIYTFFCVNNGLILKRRRFTKFNMPDSVIKKVNAYGSKTKREIYGRDLEFLNHNKKKFDWDEEDDLIDMLAQRKLYPNIPAEFPGVALESDYHLPIPAEEEEIVDENAATAAAAANAELPDNDLQDVLRTSSNFPMPDLVEVDSSDDEDSDDEDDNDDVGNPITGVPANPTSTTRSNPVDKTSKDQPTSG